MGRGFGHQENEMGLGRDWKREEGRDWKREEGRDWKREERQLQFLLPHQRRSGGRIHGEKRLA